MQEVSYRSPYHNTTDLAGAELRSREQRAQTQDEVILAHFQKYRAHHWTPSMVQRMALPNAPITSVRRSISNLTRAGKLVKANRLFRGPYGHPENAWKLR